MKTVNITADFLFGGHAIFTAASPNGAHHTYRVTTPAVQNADPVWFVSYLHGPDNTYDWSYLGLLKKDGRVIFTKNSKAGKDTETFQVAKWACKIVVDGLGDTLPEGYTIRHNGHCGLCGRRLTHPESLDTGIGPVCAGRV